VGVPKWVYCCGGVEEYKGGDVEEGKNGDAAAALPHTLTPGKIAGGPCRDFVPQAQGGPRHRCEG
jgi:hypothetical protein